MLKLGNNLKFAALIVLALVLMISAHLLLR
jgi:hypothetical protein